LLILSRFIGNIHTSACVYGYIRDRQGIGIRNKKGTDAIIVDGQFLYPLSIDFLSLMNLNSINQFIQHPGCQFLGPCILPNSRYEVISGCGSAVQLFQFSANLLDSFGKLCLFIFISAGHFRITFVREFSRKIILIDSFKQTILMQLTYCMRI